MAKAVLNQDEDAQSDNLTESWAQEINLDEGLDFSYPAKKGKLKVAVSDEGARIKITENNGPMLKEELISLGVENPQEKIDNIFDYMDADSEARGTNPDSEENAKNQELSALEELMYAANITKEDYGKMKDSLTIFGEDDKININTVLKAWLEALLDFLLNQGKIDASDKEAVLTLRFGADLIEGSADDGFYASDDDLLPALKDNFRATSAIFRIFSQAEVGGIEKKITCVFDRKNGKVLYWQE